MYASSRSAQLDRELFRDPPAEYRGAPFWAWNCKLDHDQLMRQIAIFKAMGMGGFHMHARTGLATAYLGDEFMSLVRACVERAKREGLLVWLYDEDRWPSGFAGGLATSEPRFRARQLLFTRFPYGGADSSPIRDLDAFGQRADNGVLLARYDVVLRDGRLARYCRLVEGADARDCGTVWYAYLETMLPTPWYNNQAYVDTLNPAAITRFIALTHARYAEVVGEHFGSIIPAIFTDEPQVIHKQCFAYAEEPRDLIVPWTDNLCMTYRQTYGKSLEDRLPELFWELPGDRASSARYRYHDHVCERFGTAFVDPIGAWCDAHRLALTGHLMHEPTLGSQTAALGETMRLYRGFGLPGIDILCDQREYTSVKQAQSVAHQYGRPGVLSELYGVTNWDFDFAGHKAQGDWQAALGVTMRVHHLAWVSMAGEAKRDYPASIGEQSPWHHEYRLIEDHFARLNTALTRGQPLVRVGVIHPIESYWLCFGPLDQTGSERAERERAFADLTSGLLFGMIDFDFIAESLLAELCPLEPTNDQRPTTDDRRSGPQYSLQAGAMRYDAVIVPGLRTIRATTLDRLERFHTGGGTLIFAGEIPTLVDVEPSQRAHELAETCQRVALAPSALLDALAPFREASVWQADRQPSRSILHQIRVDGDRRYAFFCNADKQRACEHSRIALQGAWHASVLETLTGAIFPIDTHICDGMTWIDWDFSAHGSVLLELDPDTLASKRDSVVPASQKGRKERRAQPWREREQLAGPVPITLSEPNVLLLDQAAFRLNDERWQPEEEILRIDALLRQRLTLPLRTSHLAQPWAQASAAAPTDTVSLRWTIHTGIDIATPCLALEDAAQTDIRLDGQLVRRAAVGWFVDQAIEIIRLPRLAAGDHEIILSRPFGPLSTLEWCYLLGDFGVVVRGRQARIVAPVRELAFGDWTSQGLPFYAGNVTYHCIVAGDGALLAVQIPDFKAPLLAVTLNGQSAGKIAFAPFQLTLGALPTGAHSLDITCYGNRVNTFGALHNANERTSWFGPSTWRTAGVEWSYAYQLRAMGILTAPRMLTKLVAESQP